MDLRILGNGSLTDLSWILSLWGRILSDTNFQISQTTVSPPHSSSHWQDIFRYFSNHIFGLMDISLEIVSKHIFLWSPTTNILPDIFQNIYLALQISHHISSNKISQDESVAISRARISSSHFVAARVETVWKVKFCRYIRVSSISRKCVRQRTLQKISKGINTKWI